MRPDAKPSSPKTPRYPQSLNREITQETRVPVWPFEEGPKRGYAFSPLHKSVLEPVSRIPGCTNSSRSWTPFGDGRAQNAIWRTNSRAV